MAHRPYRYAVIRTDPNTGEEVWFPTILAAAKATGINPGTLSRVLAFGWKCHGYIWRYDP